MCSYFRLLGTDEKNEFLEYLATDYAVDHSAVMAIVSSLPDPEQVKLRYCMQ